MEWMFMPLKRYADFSGRSRRMEFWMWTLFQVLLAFAVMVVLLMLVGGAAMSGDPTQLMAVGGAALVLYLLYLLAALIFFIPNLAVTVRRLHDTNRSGWWVMLFWGPYLLMIVASVILSASATSGVPAEGTLMAGGLVSLVSMLALLVGSLVLLVFMFLEGTRGPNRFGADPKGPEHGEVFA